MRKQYHFWPGEKGLDAWDVDRLIALSRSLEPRIVALESIAEVDSVYWFDEEEQPTVRKVIEHARLMRDVDLSYPIILGVDGRVMDGMHRIARATLDGHETIIALQFDVHPEPDYKDSRPGEVPDWPP